MAFMRTVRSGGQNLRFQPFCGYLGWKVTLASAGEAVRALRTGPLKVRKTGVREVKNRSGRSKKGIREVKKGVWTAKKKEGR